jgi:hypothetical protein
VTEIGGWIDRLAADGHLVWSLRSPVSYPSDAQLLPDGNVLVCAFTNPGRIVEVRASWASPGTPRDTSTNPTGSICFRRRSSRVLRREGRRSGPHLRRATRC